MRIHTTQNLDYLNNKITTNKNLSSKEFVNSHNFGYRLGLIEGPESQKESSVSFKKKKAPNKKDTKKVLDIIKKGLGDIKDKATPEVKKGDKVYVSSFFNALLDLAENGPVFSALTAAVICIFLRPLAIMALPTGKSKPAAPKPKAENLQKDSEAKSEVTFKGNKQKEKSPQKVNNMYASAQSISSGLFGLFAAFALTQPFSKAQSKVRENLHKYLNAEQIKKLFPWVDLASIKGKAGEILESKFWKDITGRVFKADVKLADTLPKFKHISDVSKETFEDLLKKDGKKIYEIDFVSQKGKSFNDIIVKNIETKEEKLLYEVINFDNLGIKVKEEGLSDAQILLKDLDKEYLTKLIADSKGSNEWGNLDINSVYENGVVKDFRKWKQTDGKAWKLDLDTISISSEKESLEKRPRISGKMRFDEKEQVWKFVAYQPNGENGKLGTEITNDMLKADSEIAAQLKSMTWTPDLVFRIPIAMGTIALIPWVLKNVFGLEKAKPNNVTKEAELSKNEELNKDSVQKENTVNFKGTSEKSNSIAFKGKPSSGIFSKFIDFLAAHIEAPLLKSETMKKFSRALAKLPGEPTEHMVVAGSAIQSSVYIDRTRKNKDLEDDRKNTLMLNQFLCFLVPTIVGYKANSMLRERIKKVGYDYTNAMNHKIDSLKKQGKEAAAKEAQELLDKLPTRKKAVNTLADLATFTLIYRFLSPIAVTPIANWGGDKYLEWRRAKGQAKLAKS